jgi:hypothetical protein
MKHLIILLLKCFPRHLYCVFVSRLNGDPGLRDPSSRRVPGCNDPKGSWNSPNRVATTRSSGSRPVRKEHMHHRGIAVHEQKRGLPRVRCLGM